MDPQYYALIELLLVFGLVIAFYIWQMRDLRKAKALREARERDEVSGKADD